MNEIRIRREHSLPLEHARTLAEEIARRLKDEFDLTYRWRGRALSFSRDGVEGTLTVSAGEIHLHARLGLLLTFLKPQIEREIEAHLERALAQATRQRKPRKK